MKVKIAYEHTDYLVKHLVAVGDNEVDKLDLSKQTIQWYSSGPLDPIVKVGERNAYEISEVEVPVWLVKGIARGQVDGRWGGGDGGSALYWGVRIITRDYWGDGWESALFHLAQKKGKFIESVRQFFVRRGYITPKQAAAVMRNWGRRY
jgi:hypothetical protein